MSTTPSTNGLIPKGMAFMIPPSGPVRPLSRREYEDYIWHRDHDQHIPVRVSMWTGDDIVKVSDPLGLMEWTGLDAGDTPHLTGRVLRYGQPV